MNKRNSNIELLRICCMLMIIAGHIMLNHSTSYSLTNSDEIIDLLFRGTFSVAVNTFVLISGYFGISYKIKRLFHIFIQTFFYSVSFLIVAVLLGWHKVNFRTDLFAFFPILTKQYWFVTCYVVLYVISPWLNIWIDSLERVIYKKFLIVGFLIVYLWPTFCFLINAPRFIDDSGYGIVNFVYLYMLGRFLHLYYVVRHNSMYYLGGYVLSSLILFLCQYGLSWFLGFEFTSWISYNTIFCFVGAVCLFLTFLKMSFHSSIINYWAKPCLAVYLIHMAPNVLSKFCIAVGVQECHGILYLLLVCALPIPIYYLCAIIEICRLSVFGSVENKVISYIIR